MCVPARVLVRVDSRACVRARACVYIHGWGDARGSEVGVVGRGLCVISMMGG